MRLAAYIIDSIIVAVGLLVVRLAWIGIGALISGTILDGNILFHYSLKDIVLYIFKVMYFILLTWCTGTTIGKHLMNLRVVPADRNEKLSFVDVLYRETIGRFLCGISVWVGYIIVGIDKEKRGFHDMLCDTRVVYEKKVKVYPEYQKNAGTQSAQTEAFSVPVQSQMPTQTQTSQEPQQLQEPQQSQTSQAPVSRQSQPYRAVPDGGYSFVKNVPQQSNENVDCNLEVEETEKMEDRIEKNIKEHTQEGDS